MFFNFASLPPEINSALMYSGPGAGPMLSVAAGWDELADNLYSTATSYQSVISGLTSGWQGPSSLSMAAAAAPYSAWMNAIAAQAQQAGVQAKAAAAAFETAFAMTVPPPVIAANRAQLTALVTTNFLGQNTPAIAATETHYAEMYAQDVLAMYGYAGSSAHATALTPFADPPPTTNPAGAAAQSAAVAEAAGASTGTQTQATLSQLVSSVPTTLQGLVSPATSTDPLSLLNNIVGPVLITSGSITITSSLFSILRTATPTALTAENLATPLGQSLGTTLWGGFGSGAGVLQSGSAAVLARMGGAASVPGLSVPQTWTAAAPAVSSAMASPLDASPTLQAATSEGMFGGLPMGTPARDIGDGVLRVGQRRFVMPRPVFAG